MALTLTARPTGIRSPHNGFLEYRFNESALVGKTNYKLRLQLDADVGAAIPSIVGVFVPDQSGTIRCNISELCMKFIGFNSIGNYNPWSVKTVGGLPANFCFIKATYQATWDGGGTGIVDDSPNWWICLQSIVNHNNLFINSIGKVAQDGYPELSDSKLWLLTGRPDRGIKAWVNRRTCIDFAVQSTFLAYTKMYFDLGTDDNGLDHVMTTRQVAGKSVINDYSIDNISYTPRRTTKNGRVFYSIGENATQITIGGSTSGDILPYITSTRFGQTFTATQTGPPGFHFVTPQVVGTPTKRLLFKLWSTSAGNPNAVIEQKSLYIDAFETPIESATLIFDLYVFFNTSITNGTQYAITIEPDPADTTGIWDASNYIGFALDNSNPYAGGSFKYFSGGIWNTSVGERMRMIVTKAPQSLTTNANFTYSLVVVGECENPIYLSWINDMGGRSHYMFDRSQDMVFNFNSFRNKMYTIYANDMALAEWMMIQDLNKTGTRINSTDKVGSVVLDLNQPLTDGVVITDTKAFQRVYVNPTQQRVRTKQQSYYAQLVIEYKEIQQNYSSNI